MSRKKVLVIDDEDDFGLLLKNYLSKKGFEVYISRTLREGMDAFENIRPDILFLDNNLPDGLGWEKTDYVMNKLPNIKCILISAYQHDNFTSNKYPTVKILEKPINIVELNSYLS